MKAETLQKRIEKIATKKDGSLYSNFAPALRLILGAGKVHKGTTGRGRFTKITDTDFVNAKNYLSALKIDFEIGNDAQRGGKTGDYVALSEKGKKQIEDFAENSELGVAFKVIKNNSNTRANIYRNAYVENRELSGEERKELKRLTDVSYDVAYKIKNKYGIDLIIF